MRFTPAWSGLLVVLMVVSMVQLWRYRDGDMPPVWAWFIAVVYGLRGLETYPDGRWSLVAMFGSGLFTAYALALTATWWYGMQRLRDRDSTTP